MTLDRRDSESDEGKNTIVISALLAYWHVLLKCSNTRIVPNIHLYALDKRAVKLSEKDRKIGHRRINEEGEVSYKKIHSNQLVASIQLGIQVTLFI